MPLPTAATSSSVLTSWWSQFIESESSFFIFAWQWVSGFFFKRLTPSVIENNKPELTKELSEDLKRDLIETLPENFIGGGPVEEPPKVGVLS